LVYVRHQEPLAGVELTTFGLRDTTATCLEAQPMHVVVLYFIIV
jgi:hypothetical protein